MADRIADPVSRFMFNQGGGIIPVPGNDSFTKILLHFDGANGGTSFPDVNAAGVSATWSSGGPTTSTVAKQYGTASLKGNSSGGVISSAAISNYLPGSGDFTLDFWVNLNGASSNKTLMSISATGASVVRGIVVYYVSSVSSIAVDASFGTTVSPLAVVSNTGWHHIAVVKSGTSITLYIDGVAGSTKTTSTSAMSNDAFSVFQIGSHSPSFLGTTGPLAGYIDEFRWSVGIARWTSNFVPPTGPYI